jgi:enoyl-CoA hydratase/carnithine racemase
MELLLTGERISARQGDRTRGLGGAARRVDGRSARSPRLVRPPLAARATKEVAVRTQSMSSVEAIRFGETMRRVAGATEDASEGGRAAAEGRPPVWRGR